MRNTTLGILAAALCAIAMCSFSPAQAADDMSMPATPAQTMPNLPGPLSHTIMQAYMDYLKGDIDSLVALTTDDVEWGGVGPEGMGAPFGDYHGHDGVRRWFSELAAGADTYKLTDLEFHEDGTTVWVVGKQSTTLKNGNMEMSPFAHFFKFRDGKVTNFWNFLDSAGVVAAASGGMGMAGGDKMMGGMGHGGSMGGMGMGGGMSMGGGDMSEQNIAALQAGYAAFGSGDMDKLLSGFTDDIQWDAVGPAGVLPIFGHFTGKDQVKQWFMNIGSALDMQPFRDVKFIASGDTVVSFGMSKATYRATGKVVDSPFVHIARFRDGKIFWMRCFEDTASDVMAAK